MVYGRALTQLLCLSFSYCRYNVQLFTAYDDIHVFGAEHLQQITHPSPQYQKIDVLVIGVLQQITNPISIT
jgi:hypothetical protein